ncbi:hypothetical protein [Microbacterium testaceum]|uniref:hypothetical protein n=1 Tax=Microbacterium testaceum TaxID=2033 RepID=UPI000ADD800F|nr:hypothetical protein [Microbacterium testaceum]
MRDLQLAELDYSWAESTFDGTGFGVVGVSRNWTWGVSASREGISECIGAQGIDVITENSAGMQFDPAHPFGAALVLKRALGRDIGGRPGRYVARLLIDPTTTLTAVDALRLAARELPRTSWPMDAQPTNDLSAPIVRGESPGMEPNLHVLAATLCALNSDGLVIVAGLGEPLTAFADALDALPPMLSRRLAVSTFNAQRHMSEGVVLSEHTVLGDGDGIQVVRVNDSGIPDLLRESDFRDLAARCLQVPISTRRNIVAASVGELARAVDSYLEQQTPVSALSEERLLSGILNPRTEEPRRSDCIEELVQRERDGAIDPVTRRRALDAFPPSLLSALVGRLSAGFAADRTRDPVAALKRWGGTREECRDLAFAALDGAVGTADATSTWRAAVEPYVQEWVATRDPDTALAATVGDPWLAQVLSASWGPGTRCVIESFWVAGVEPLPSLAPLAATLTRKFRQQTTNTVLGARPTTVRLDRSLSLFSDAAERELRPVVAPPPPRSVTRRVPAEVTGRAVGTTVDVRSPAPMLGRPAGIPAGGRTAASAPPARSVIPSRSRVAVSSNAEPSSGAQGKSRRKRAWRTRVRSTGVFLTRRVAVGVWVTSGSAALLWVPVFADESSNRGVAAVGFASSLVSLALFGVFVAARRTRAGAPSEDRTPAPGGVSSEPGAEQLPGGDGPGAWHRGRGWTAP